MKLARLTETYEASESHAKHTSENLASGQADSTRVPQKLRKACFSFPSKAAIGLDQYSFQDTARHSDNALVSLGETVRQSFAKLAIPIQSLLQLLVLLGKKNGGSRTIAILHTTYRLTMRLVSTHISQWDVMFAGE